MALPRGARLGPYEITSPIGAGGMGEVYKGRDTRLNRDVAIKVLQPELARSPEFRQRFEREALTVSSLNHPHICTLYDIGQQDGVDYLVMELLEGETLAERLKRGPLPPDQVLRYALQMASALEQAHKRVAAHRDLKPGNIMLTRNGVKLLDFGLARPVTVSKGVDAATLTLPLSTPGAVLGTVPYMAPEQLEGKDCDHRADIFALGAVLYEMTTGRRAFQGDSQASVIAAIMRQSPPAMSMVAPQSPPGLDWVVEQCLQKDIEERWQTAHDLRLQIERSMQASVQAIRGSSRVRTAAIAIASALLAAVAAWKIAGGRPREAPGVFRFEIDPPPKAEFTAQLASVRVPMIALSPDGKQLAFVASIAGQAMLWVRALDETTPRVLAGTEGAMLPFWSPDGNHLGFFARNKLKRISRNGGPPQILADVSADPRGGSWSRDGVIVFAPHFSQGIQRIPAAGGTVETVPLPKEFESHGFRRFPHFLPDGRHFLFIARGPKAEARAAWASSLDGMPPRKLANTDHSVAYVEPGFLLYINNDTLMARKFDAAQMELSGEPFVAVQPVGGSSTGASGFSAARNGTLAYSSKLLPPAQLSWYERSGRQTGAVGEPGDFVDVMLSPDGQRVAFSRTDPTLNTPDIWIHDLSRGTTTRLTTDPLIDASPLFSPDGLRILYRNNQTGIASLWEKPVSGGESKLILGRNESPESQKLIGSIWCTDWSRDGRHVVFVSSTALGFDLWALPAGSGAKPIPLVRTPFTEVQGVLSPSGNWLAYASDESGRFEIYVQAFPKASGRNIVSTDGGAEPRWRGDGRELFYLALDGKLMSVPVQSQGEFQAGQPQALFQTRTSRWVNPFRTNYVPTRDGQRFLVNTLLADAAPAPVVVVTNWLDGRQ